MANFPPHIPFKLYIWTCLKFDSINTTRSLNGGLGVVFDFGHPVWPPCLAILFGPLEFLLPKNDCTGSCKFKLPYEHDSPT